jgi:hypothetical protein
MKKTNNDTAITTNSYKNMSNTSAAKWLTQNFALSLEAITKLLAVKTAKRSELAADHDLRDKKYAQAFYRLGVLGLITVTPMTADVKGQEKIERTYRVNSRTSKVRDDKTLRATLRAVKDVEPAATRQSATSTQGATDKPA